jgi:hypothetical protein
MLQNQLPAFGAFRRKMQFSLLAKSAGRDSEKVSLQGSTMSNLTTAPKGFNANLCADPITALSAKMTSFYNVAAVNMECFL